MAGAIVGLSMFGCSSPNSEFDEVLNKFDEMVGVYENYTRKEPFCVEYVVQINGEVLTKLNDLADKAKKLKESGPEPNKQQVDRYVQISTRMSTAMLALGTRMKGARMCGGALGAAPPGSAVPGVGAPGAAPPSVPVPDVVAAPAAEAAPPSQPAPAPDASRPEVGRPEAAAVAAPAEAVRPSFDCAKASTGSERMICGSPELARLDVQLADVYRKAQSGASDQQQLRSEQVSWIRQSRKCEDEGCLAQSYKTRIAELAKLARQ